MNRSFVALVIAGCAAASGCSSTTTADVAQSTPLNAGRTSDTTGGGSTPPTPGPSESSSSTPGAPQRQGQLTAGVWDDNLNFEFFAKYLEQSKTMAGASIFSQAERDAAHQRASQRGPKTQLDVAIVLDTTSSMGDELAYLQAEFESIASTVQAKYPGTTPRFGLVVYRDHVDEYLTRSTAFTTDVQKFRATLGAQSAAGGGDIPEAVPEGLAAGVALDWRTTDDSVARVMFWVADAPQHPGEEQAVNAAVKGAVAKGIHVYPVGASGVDQSAELTMRGTAQITGGRYVFLTDDSGIGNSHAEPHIPCYLVTPLQGAIVRMVDSEMTGARAEADPKEIIRTVGAPNAGKCTIQDKSQVVLY